MDTAFRVEWATAERFEMLRLAYLPAGDPALVGPMCCSPERAGLEVQFTGFLIGDPIPRDLHP
jgi:regulation of enolase protein 1 (concanavalin A-like superfamily)